MSYPYVDYPPLPLCYPPFTPMYPPAANPPIPSEIRIHPSVMEQMGADPISRLAAAIEKLAEALAERNGCDET